MSVPTQPAALCPACGYDLRGLGPGRCPECGVRFRPDELPTSFDEAHGVARFQREATIAAAFLWGVFVVCVAAGYVVTRLGLFATSLAFPILGTLVAMFFAAESIRHLMRAWSGYRRIRHVLNDAAAVRLKIGFVRSVACLVAPPAALVALARFIPW